MTIELTQALSVLSTILAMIATTIGLVNSKSKSDKADAIQIKELEMKLDSIIDKVTKIERDMYSVNQDENVTSKEVVIHKMRLDAIESRLDRLESKE